MSSAPVRAYQQELTSEAIREAFFLGSRNDEITADFWNHYERVFPSRSTTLHVGAVEVLTPYAQVVFAAQHHMADENAVDAVQKYASRDVNASGRAMRSCMVWSGAHVSHARMNDGGFPS